MGDNRMKDRMLSEMIYVEHLSALEILFEIKNILEHSSVATTSNRQKPINGLKYKLEATFNFYDKDHSPKIRTTEANLTATTL